MFDCVKAAGPIVVKSRELPPFNSIFVEDKIDLIITQGPEWKVILEAGKNLHINIKTEVRDSILYIDDGNKCNFVRNPKKKVTIYITMPRIKSLESHGVGVTTFANRFEQDSLSLRLFYSGDVHVNVSVDVFQTVTHGNADVYAEGYAGRCSHYTNGTNFIYDERLVVKDYIYVETFSVGHCYINAPLNGPIEGNIRSKGNIYYKGEPTFINVSTYNSGKLIKQ
jgi:hypothetical protein